MDFETIIEYCFRHMISKPLAAKFLCDYGIEVKPSHSYSKIASLAEAKSKEIKIEDLTAFFFGHYKFMNTDFHYSNLASGLLVDHSWNGARPSTLHLSLQDKVRDFIRYEGSLEELITVGSNIMKHEYFMVATHDLLVDEFILAFTDRVIPPIGNKSVSDFIFDGMPYDLKNTNLPTGFNYDPTDVLPLIKNLVFGADTERLRKQAQGSLNGWGLNRFFAIVLDQDRWLLNPKDVVQNFLSNASELQAPYKLNFEGYEIYSHILII